MFVYICRVDNNHNTQEEIKWAYNVSIYVV